MGNWDSIYKQYQQSGDAWATLSEGIDKRFVEMLEKTNFNNKRVLDIGCGTGKYLQFLESRGFIVDSIDSSPTAIEMTKRVSKNPSSIMLEDMYEYSYLENSYDLIISVSTLHHGRKTQIKNAIRKIYKSLKTGGIIFITLPNFDACKTWETFKNNVEIEPGTYAPTAGPEKGILHSFYTEHDCRELFSEFNNVTLDIDEIGRWFIVASK